MNENTNYNPLLDIDTSFETYLKARTRNFKDKMVGSQMNYAFDADFSLRLKLSSFAGWNKISKTVTTGEIPNRFKKAFKSAVVAGVLTYPEVYNAMQKCAERLEISVLKIYVRKESEKCEIYSIVGENIEPSIVITSALAEKFTSNELQFLIGCECGHIQNNHSIYIMSAPQFGLPADSHFITPVSEEAVALTYKNTMMQWLCLADVTADRAGIICLDDPKEFPSVFADIREKGIDDIYTRQGYIFDKKKVSIKYETLHITPARSIRISDDFTLLDKRYFSAMEFLNCEILYNWRTEIEKIDVHTVNKQALEVRCEIITGSDNSKGGDR